MPSVPTPQVKADRLAAKQRRKKRRRGEATHILELTEMFTDKDPVPGKLKKDGSPDMKYTVNKEWLARVEKEFQITTSSREIQSAPTPQVKADMNKIRGEASGEQNIPAETPIAIPHERLLLNEVIALIQNEVVQES
jgi:hypothetical protein